MDVKIIPKKLSGTLAAPPSKSHAHRVLIAQKLARIQSGRDRDFDIPSFSQDIEATKNCLVQLDKAMPYLDCKESGSTLRFMIPVAMALKDEAVFMGTGKLPERPISPLKEEMEAHGCVFSMGDRNQKVSDRYKEICTVRGRLQPGAYRLAGNISSQFITGLLFALPVLSGDSTLELTTKLESAGYVDLTLDVLRDFGIDIKERTSSEGFNIYEIKGNQRYVEPDKTSIQCDWSNAAFWLACGALGGDVTLTGLDLASSQRDKEFTDILREMGAELSLNAETAGTLAAVDAAPKNPGNSESSGGSENPGNSENPGSSLCSIRCTGNDLRAVEVNVSQIPDLVPVLASVMSLARGASLITHAERLRIKESDRLSTVYDFLSRLGADITDGGDGLSLTGLENLTGGEVYGHNDHRIVMAAAVASCGCTEPVIIRGAQAVSKSYPDFFKDFAALGGEVHEI